MRNIIIFGDGQLAERFSKYVISEGKDKFVAFTQERQFISREMINGYPVIPFEDLRTIISEEFEIILGIGYAQMNLIRERAFHKCKSYGYKLGNYISVHAICYSDNIGAGNFICPGALIGPDCKIGDGNYIGSYANLSHDNQIGSYNYISINVALGGYAKVGNSCFVGMKSAIRDGITIADEVLIGASSNIIKSIEVSGCVYVGNPAKILPEKQSKDIKI